MSQHTPGPWSVGPIDDTMVTHIAADGKRYEIAAVDGDYNDPDTWPIMEANARLIAAAPDLLAALNACRAHIALMTNQMQQFVEPSGYTAFDRKRIAFEHDREAKESLFMGDMIYLLDGPEQRELSSKCDAALAKIGTPA